jgi:hypothetical protein
VVAAVVFLGPKGVHAQVVYMAFVVLVACILQLICMPYKVKMHGAA